MMPPFRPAVFLVAVLFALMSCTAPGTGSKGQSGQEPTSSPLATASPTSPPPTPGPVPTNCPISNPVRHTVPGLVPVIGASPVWATWPPGLGIFHLTPQPPYPSTYEAPYGWQMTKLIWEVGPHSTQLVTVRGHDQFDNTPLQIQFQDPPTAVAVLDPQHPDHPASVVGADWAEWGSYIVVPKAGCNTMEVSWPTGHWEVTFAAGA
jgi:hypothetical protein